ncbi:MAG TPA: hypothetical protein VH637_00405 [Streptosporangiaceae bacterium]|jgi:hypothetical protein
MTSRRIARAAAALALAAGSTTAVIAAAGPASAITCTPIHTLAYYPPVNGPASVAGQNYMYCDGFRDYLTMDIYKLESGTWVQVATGPGHAAYLCNGTTSNQFKDQSGDQISAPCV